MSQAGSMKASLERTIRRVIVAHTAEEIRNEDPTSLFMRVDFIN